MTINGIPDFDGIVILATGDPLAIRTTSHTFDSASVAVKGSNLMTRGGIPNFDLGVPATADDPLAARAESHGGDGTNVSLEAEELPTGSNVPDLQFSFFLLFFYLGRTEIIYDGIPAGSNDSLPIGAKGHALDLVVVMKGDRSLAS